MNAQNLVAQDTIHFVQETGRPNNQGNKKLIPNFSPPF